MLNPSKALHGAAGPRHRIGDFAGNRAFHYLRWTGNAGVKQQGCHGRWKRTSWHFLLGKVFEALEATTPISSFSPILSCPSTAQALSSYFPLCQWRAPHFVCPSVHPSIQHSVSTYFAHTLVQLLGSEEEAVIEHGETYPNK